MLESFSLDRYYSEKLFQLIGSFPIIGEIIQQGPAKLKQILQFCKFFKYLPREEIIGKGRYNPWIFYVLNGECLVMDEAENNQPIEVIQTGQLFGELDVVLDATGGKTVVADPKSQEVVLLGLNSSVFTTQTKTRLLDDRTRVIIFQALYHSLLQRYKMMGEILKKTGQKQDDYRYEPLGFSGDRESKEHLVFFDVESKKLVMMMTRMRSAILAAVKKGDQNLPAISTFLTNQKFNKLAIYAYTHELPYKLRSTKEDDETNGSQEVQTELEKKGKKQVYLVHELSFLVVDDDEHHRETAVKILRELGAGKIHVEQNGQAAWNFICAHPTKIDIVLCDWIMPEMTGLDLYNNIQSASEHLLGIIFIMLTSIESKTSVLEAVESGVHGYVIKPLTQKNILKQIQQALKHVRGAVLKI
jgi:two-component system chemotaxis response regulator CheY